MRGDDLNFRDNFFERSFKDFHVLDARADIKTLSAAVMLAQEGFANNNRVVWQYKGAHGQAVNGRGSNEAHFLDAC